MVRNEKKEKFILVLVQNFQQHKIRPACDQPKKKGGGIRRSKHRHTKNQQHVQSIFEDDKLSCWSVWTVLSFSERGDFLLSGKKNAGEKGMMIMLVIYLPFDVYPQPVAIALSWWLVMTMSRVNSCSWACARVPRVCSWEKKNVCNQEVIYLYLDANILMFSKECIMRKKTIQSSLFQFKWSTWDLLLPLTVTLKTPFLHFLFFPPSSSSCSLS